MPFSLCKLFQSVVVLVHILFEPLFLCVERNATVTDVLSPHLVAGTSGSVSHNTQSTDALVPHGLEEIFMVMRVVCLC